MNEKTIDVEDYIDKPITHNYTHRKHFNNMTKEERLYLITIKNNLLKSGLTFAKHALNRMDERYIKEKDVLRALRYGQILEYQKNDIDEVIIVRGCHLNRKNEHIYVIFSISESKVITTYPNKYWRAYKKMRGLEKHNTNFDIEIPEDYKLKIQFYFA